jgi:hypothetical protein
MLLCVSTLVAQQPPVASPPAKAWATVGGVKVSINYSSPRVKGRQGHLFGPDGRISKDPHYPVWRGGANEATTMVTEGDLKFGDLLVPRGTYTLFYDISDPNNWVLVISKDTGEWGLSYDKTKDLGRVKTRMAAPPALVENLDYSFKDLGNGRSILTLSWENHSSSVMITTP